MWTFDRVHAENGEQAAFIYWRINGHVPVRVLALEQRETSLDGIPVFDPADFGLGTRVPKPTRELYVQLNEINDKLDRLLAGQVTQSKEETDMAQTIQDTQAAVSALTDRVAALTSASSSAEALLTGLNDQLKAALANQDTTALNTAISNISQTIDANVKGLSDAVAANTPAAAPSPAPAPATSPG